MIFINMHAILWTPTRFEVCIPVECAHLPNALVANLKFYTISIYSVPKRCIHKVNIPYYNMYTSFLGYLYISDTDQCIYFFRIIHLLLNSSGRNELLKIRNMSRSGYSLLLTKLNSTTWTPYIFPEFHTILCCNLRVEIRAEYYYCRAKCALFIGMHLLHCV
jgi:hypothetical protein